MSVEVWVAILVSAIGLLMLPRQRMRQFLATASPLGRTQYGLLLVPSLVIAALLWVDLWERSQGHRGSQQFTLLMVATALWGVVLAATRLPDIMSGRGSLTAPVGWPFGNAMYRATLRAGPTLVGAAFLVTLAYAASLLSGRGVLDFRVVVLLSLAAFLAILLAFITGLTGWPAMLIPPPLRQTHGDTHRVHRE